MAPRSTRGVFCRAAAGTSVGRRGNGGATLVHGPGTAKGHLPLSAVTLHAGTHVYDLGSYRVGDKQLTCEALRKVKDEVSG